MRILELEIAGFGGLRGKWRFEPGRVNVILDDNERGKSTLFAAITAALYGLDADRRTHRVVTPLERWRPWGGGAYRIVLALECESGPYRIARDFDSGTVAVFDRTGSEVTPRFLDDRDEYPVGRVLLGLDRTEFEKCVLLAQGELDAVVPADEKARRASTLKSRLENAADSHVGDTNASEAMRVLEESLRQYHVAELDFTGTIDNALARLESKRDAVEVEIREIEATLVAAQAPIDDLHQLSQNEQRLQERLRELEVERRAGLAVDLRRTLEEQDAALTEVARLEGEAAGLVTVAALSPTAEDELRDSVARLETATRSLADHEKRHHDEVGREREAIALELRDLTAYGSFTVEDADRCVAMASDLRHVLMQDTLLRHQVFELRDALAAKGHVPEQIQFLQQRFGELPAESVELLRQQAELNLGFQNESQGLESQRTTATDTLREVDEARTARRAPAWVLTSVGALLAVSGLALWLLRDLMVPGFAVSGLGFAVLVGGLLMLGSVGRLRRDERNDALRSLGEAQSRLNALHLRRTENEAGLSGIARGMGYRDSVDLLRQFSEYVRLVEDSGPLFRAQAQLAELDERRRRVMDEAQPLFAASGQSVLTPDTLELVAHDARRSLVARQRLADLDRGLGWVEGEKRSLEETVRTHRERALAVLAAAGIPYDAARGWSHHVSEMRRLMESRLRHALVVEELLPAARRRLQPEAEIAQRRRQLDLLLAGGELPPHARSSADVDLEVRNTRAELEDVQRQRENRRVEVEEVWRRHAQKRPELDLEQDRLGRAIERAVRFKGSIEIARDTVQKVATDTHRKWADFLNDRVGAILASFGSSVEGVRFGEDLDFSVQLRDGPLVSRGKAHLHLSSGARDQLYLAVRLAIGEFLSRGGESLPLLVDDVFATSDDDRLRAGMRSLIEGLGAGHQVLYATCHRSRVNELRRLDPDLHRDRVHVVDLRATSSPVGR
ncbi:MAG: hypothetical protein RL721_1132 [Candidatus Eisenbacteria bacterium]|jgi:hypothetical protein